MRKLIILLVALVAMAACTEETEIQQKEVLKDEAYYKSRLNNTHPDYTQIYKEKIVTDRGTFTVSIDIHKDSTFTLSNIKSIREHLAVQSQSRAGNPGGLAGAFWTACATGYSCWGWTGPYNAIGGPGEEFTADWYMDYTQCENWAIPMAYYGVDGVIHYLQPHWGNEYRPPLRDGGDCQYWW